MASPWLLDGEQGSLAGLDRNVVVRRSQDLGGRGLERLEPSENLVYLLDHTGPLRDVTVTGPERSRYTYGFLPLLERGELLQRARVFLHFLHRGYLHRIIKILGVEGEEQKPLLPGAGDQPGPVPQENKLTSHLLLLLEYLAESPFHARMPDTENRRKGKRQL